MTFSGRIYFFHFHFGHLFPFSILTFFPISILTFFPYLFWLSFFTISLYSFLSLHFISFHFISLLFSFFSLLYSFYSIAVTHFGFLPICFYSWEKDVNHNRWIFIFSSLILLKVFRFSKVFVLFRRKRCKSQLVNFHLHYLFSFENLDFLFLSFLYYKKKRKWSKNKMIYRSFVAEMGFYVNKLGRPISAREAGSNKQTASKSCALSLVRQLFHLGVIEAFSGTLKKNKEVEDLPPYDVSV